MEAKDMQAIQGFVFALLMLAIEITMVCRWLAKKYLYRKKMKVRQFIARSKTLYQFLYYYHIKEMLSLSSQMEVFLKDNENIYKEAFFGFIKGSAEIIVFSLISIYATIAKGAFSFQVILFFAACVTLKSLGKDRIVATTNTLDQYIKFLTCLDMEFSAEMHNIMSEIRRNKARLDIRKEMRNWHKMLGSKIRKTIVFFAASAIYLLYFLDVVIDYVRGDMDGLEAITRIYKAIGVIWVIIFCYIAFLLLLRIYYAMHYEGYTLRQIISGGRKEDIKVCSELGFVEKDICNMCSILKIRRVGVEIGGQGQDLAYAYTKDYIKYTIALDGFHLEGMHQYFPPDLFRNVILFILGHELTHISKKASLKLPMAKIRLLVIAGILVCLWAFYKLFIMLGIINIFIMLALTFLLLVLAHLLLSPMKKEDYQKQVRELQADRISMKLSGLDPSVFLKFTIYCTEKKIGTDIDRVHPGNAFRYQELLHHTSWGIMDYIRYSLRYQLNRILKKEEIL